MADGRSTTVAVVPESDGRLDVDRDGRTRFRHALDRIGELNKDEDPEEVRAFVTEVVEEVRQEWHERERRDAPGRR